MADEIWWNKTKHGCFCPVCEQRLALNEEGEKDIGEHCPRCDFPKVVHAAEPD